MRTQRIAGRGAQFKSIPSDRSHDSVRPPHILVLLIECESVPQCFCAMRTERVVERRRLPYNTDYP